MIQYNYILIPNECIFTLTLFIRTEYNMNLKSAVLHQASECTSTFTLVIKMTIVKSNFT